MVWGVFIFQKNTIKGFRLTAGVTASFYYNTVKVSVSQLIVLPILLQIFSQNMLPANFSCWQCKYQGHASIYISCTQLCFSPLWDWNYRSSSCICSTALYLTGKFSEPTSCFSFSNSSLVKYANGSWKTETERCVQLVSELLLSMLAPLLCTKSNPFSPFPSAHRMWLGTWDTNTSRRIPEDRSWDSRQELTITNWG